MPASQVVDLCRHSLLEVLLLASPILVIAVAVSLLINIVQVMTSIQDTTVTTVPRLTAVGIILFVLTPWMLNHLVSVTLLLFADFHPYTH